MKKRTRCVCIRKAYRPKKRRISEQKRKIVTKYASGKKLTKSEASILGHLHRKTFGKRRRTFKKTGVSGRNLKQRRAYWLRKRRAKKRYRGKSIKKGKIYFLKRSRRAGDLRRKIFGY